MTDTAERLVEELETQGVEFVFGYPGGRVIELFEHLPDSAMTLASRSSRGRTIVTAESGRCSNSSMTRPPG